MNSVPRIGGSFDDLPAAYPKKFVKCLHTRTCTLRVFETSRTQKPTAVGLLKRTFCRSARIKKWDLRFGYKTNISHLVHYPVPSRRNCDNGKKRSPRVKELPNVYVDTHCIFRRRPTDARANAIAIYTIIVFTVNLANDVAITTR